MINLSMSEKQHLIRYEFNKTIYQIELIVFGKNHYNVLLQDKPQELKLILFERDLLKNKLQMIMNIFCNFSFVINIPIVIFYLIMIIFLKQ